VLTVNFAAVDSRRGAPVVSSLIASQTFLGISVDPDAMFAVGLVLCIFVVLSFRNWSGWFYFDVRTRSGRRSFRWRLYLLCCSVVALATGKGVALPPALLVVVLAMFVLEPLVTKNVATRVPTPAPVTHVAPEPRHARAPAPRSLLAAFLAVLLAPTVVVLVYSAVAALAA
jgi:hypothetical protein